LFDAADRLAAGHSEGIIGLMIVLSTADPPDAATRQENSLRLRQLGRSLRRLVAVPVGDSLWLSIVRTVMRGMSVVAQAPLHVGATPAHGIDKLLECASPSTPRRFQVERDLEALYRALDAVPPGTAADRA
jgi:hypothetical protein